MVEFNNKELTRYFSFWNWLFTDGFYSLFDRWIFFHIAFGIATSLAINGKISQIAFSTMVPISVAVVGVAVAWSANLSNILNSASMKRLVRNTDINLYKTYINKFQLSLLSGFLLFIIWGIVGVGLFDQISIHSSNCTRMISRTILFAFTSFVIRECWQTIRAIFMHCLQAMLIDQSE